MLHSQLLAAILKAPVIFFDITPVSVFSVCVCGWVGVGVHVCI